MYRVIQVLFFSVIKREELKTGAVSPRVDPGRWWNRSQDPTLQLLFLAVFTASCHACTVSHMGKCKSKQRVRSLQDESVDHML